MTHTVVLTRTAEADLEDTVDYIGFVRMHERWFFSDFFMDGVIGKPFFYQTLRSIYCGEKETVGYLTHHALRQFAAGQILENLVCIELKRRGAPLQLPSAAVRQCG